MALFNNLLAVIALVCAILAVSSLVEANPRPPHTPRPADSSHFLVTYKSGRPGAGLSLECRHHHGHSRPTSSVVSSIVNEGGKNMAHVEIAKVLESPRPGPSTPSAPRN